MCLPLFLGLTKVFEKLRRFGEATKTSFSVAANKGDLVFCIVLLCDGATVVSVNTREQTLLYIASSRGHSDVCNLLIFCGAYVKKVNDSAKPLFGQLLMEVLLIFRS